MAISSLLRTRRLGVVALSVLALLVAGCGSDAGPADADAASEDGDPAGGAIADAATLHVVATTSILGDIVEDLVQDDGEVTVVMPPGADPHGFQPSAADAAALREADLVVANGLDLEESLRSVLQAAEDDGVRVFELAPELDPLPFGSAVVDEHPDGHDHAHEDEHVDGDDHAHPDEDAHDDEHDHAHGPDDPHVWFDPVRMADGVHLIAAELAAVDQRLDDDVWTQRAEDYADRLLEVHTELEALFAAIPDENRRLVTNHDALGYLAHRYGFEVLGTVIPGASTQAETDPQRFAELIATVERAGVPAVFAENTDSTRLAEQLASEVLGRSDLDLEVVPLYTDALGEPGSGAGTYLGLLRTTAQRIADALS